MIYCMQCQLQEKGVTTYPENTPLCFIFDDRQENIDNNARLSVQTSVEYFSFII